MRKPRLTPRVLDGLMEAWTRMEADDLTDLDKDGPDRIAAFDAAGKWLNAMAQHMAERAAKRKPADDDDEDFERDRANWMAERRECGDLD